MQNPQTRKTLNPKGFPAKSKCYKTPKTYPKQALFLVAVRRAAPMADERSRQAERAAIVLIAPPIKSPRHRFGVRSESLFSRTA
jgi:hypothetical protein